MPDIQNNCVFCDIVAGKAPAYIIHQDELSLCILDIQPLTKGHCLVIPKRHVPWWYDLTREEGESLFTVAQTVAQKIMRVYKPDFVSMYARGRRIPHTHIFLVPTTGGDPVDRLFSSLEGFQESPIELARLRGKESMADVVRTLTIKE